jgi:hypothetical protein
VVPFLEEAIVHEFLKRVSLQNFVGENLGHAFFMAHLESASQPQEFLIA